MQPDSADDNVAYTALKEYNTSLMNKPITSTSSPSLTDRSRGVVDLFGRQTGGMNTTAVESTAVGIKPNNNRVFDFLENIFKRGN